MERITIEGVEYVVIDREDGSKLTIQASSSNPEYLALTTETEE